MNQPSRPPRNNPPIDFWTIGKMSCTAVITLPTIWFRFQPMFADFYHLWRTRGWLQTPHWLRDYFVHLYQHFGHRLFWECLQILVLALVILFAIHALQILFARLILVLGFRVEEAGASALLHPEEDDQ